MGKLSSTKVRSELRLQITLDTGSQITSLRKNEDLGFCDRQQVRCHGQFSAYELTKSQERNGLPESISIGNGLQTRWCLLICGEVRLKRRNVFLHLFVE